MTTTNRRFTYLHLFIFPAAFLTLQILLKIDYKWFYLSGHDPVYAFLFNGLNLAQGNFQLGLSGFPGTTLQTLVGLNIFLLNLFSGNAPLAETVLANPEYYLQIISYEIVAFNTLALLFLGLFIYKRTGNVTLSLALQLTPMISLRAFCNNSVIMLEPLMLCIEIFILAIMVYYAFGNKKFLDRKSIIVLGILMALGIATKIVFIPLVLLPLFAIENFRKKLLYASVIALSLGVFLIPIYPTFSSFLQWNFTIFSHTGVYGSGNYDLFDPVVYARNLNSIFHSNGFLTVAIIFITLATLITHIPAIRRTLDSQKLNVLFGLFLVFMLNILMVAKHFSNHYLYISYHLVVFTFVLLISLVPFRKFVSYPNFYREPVKIITVYITGLVLLFMLIRGIDFSPSFVNPRLRAVEFLDTTVKNTQRIIVLEYSCPFMETALYHGLAYSGGMKPVYSAILKKDFPSSYFYNVSQQNFHDWIHDYNLYDLLSRSSSTFLYYPSKTDTFPEVLLGKLREFQKTGFISEVKTWYKDPEYRDYIYEIKSDTQKLSNSITRHKPVYCDFESVSVDANYFQTSDTVYRLSKAELQSQREAFSGNSSINLHPGNPYGPGINFKPKKGFYEISVRRLSEDGIGMIVASDKSGKLYKANGTLSEKKNGWDLISLTVDIPEELTEDEISIYLWYPGKGKCFFDDFTVTSYELKK